MTDSESIDPAGLDTAGPDGSETAVPDAAKLEAAGTIPGGPGAAGTALAHPNTASHAATASAPTRGTPTAGPPAELLAYAKRATSAISGFADRRAARLELHEHAVARYEELVASGATPADALRETLDRLGDSDDYATELRRTSRPPLTLRNVAVVVAVAVLATLAVLALITWFLWVNGGITLHF